MYGLPFCFIKKQKNKRNATACFVVRLNVGFALKLRA